MNDNRWLLPEGIEELLPRQAARFEHLQRTLLDLYTGWGYERVIPPFIEYVESLLIGTGSDLDLQTFKLIDQSSGRLMGVRADMTPQVARIDAHILKRDVPTRLCYLGTVLHTRPANHGGHRSLIQVGAELYGHAGLESDLEILRLMVATLQCVGLEQIHLDLGHVGIYRSLARQCNLSPDEEAILFDALQRKAIPEINARLADWDLDSAMKQMLGSLARLNGAPAILDTAARELAAGGEYIQLALRQLDTVATALGALPGVQIHLDLAELRGYRYHTGIIFSAFMPGHGHSIAQGGRYDDIGKVFGRARPATGFSTDLRGLLALLPADEENACGILAPWGNESGLEEMIAQLRASGERVVQALPGQSGDAAAMGCDRILIKVAGVWQAEKC